MEKRGLKGIHDDDVPDCDNVAGNTPNMKTNLSPDVSSSSSNTTHFLNKESPVEDRDSLAGIMNEMIRGIVPKLDDGDDVNITASELLDRMTEEQSEIMHRPPSLFEKSPKEEESGEGASRPRVLQTSVFPPSGPFVVGDQMDVMAEALAGKFLHTSAASSSSLHKPCMLSDSSPRHSPTGLEPNPFFSHVMEKVKWHPRLSDQGSLPLRRSLEYQALGSRTTPRQQKVRTDLSLSDRVRLINMSESTGKSQRSLAAEFHISVGSVNNILRRKREYLEAFEKKEKQPGPSGKKFCQSHPAPKTSSFNELHILLVRWLEIARMKAKPLSWPIILEKAREFAAKLNITDFATSSGWLERLKQTLDVSSPLASLSSETDTKLFAMWKKMLPFLMQGYNPEDIFAVTETALYYKCLPDRCFVGGSTCKDSNCPTDALEHRLTVLLCCNALGERLKPLVISRHIQPESLAGIRLTELPVVWCHQPDGVITAEIFAGWLRSLDAAMGQQRRQIALFMDMTPSHLASVLLKHTNLKFFLDSSAHLLQPLNQGVVRMLKAYYRRRLLQAVLAHAAATDSSWQVSQSVSVLDAVFWIQEAWRNISTETIAIAFRAAAFPHNLDPGDEEKGSFALCPLPSDLYHLVQRCGDIFQFTPMAVETFVEFDSQIPCHQGENEDWENCLVSEAVSQQIKSEPDDSCNDKRYSGSRHSSTDEEGGHADIVTTADALDCLNKLKQFCVRDITLLTTVYQLESLVLDSLNSTQHPLPSGMLAGFGHPLMPICCD